MVRTIVISFVLLACQLLSACGVYSFNKGGSSEYEALAIERFENSTAEYELADRITDLVIDAFISDGTFQIVPRSAADAILVGSLTGYRTQEYKYDQSDNVESFRLVMDFQIVLKNPKDDSDIWSELITKEAVYDVVDQDEQDAQVEAISRLIDQIITRTTKSW